MSQLSSNDWLRSADTAELLDLTTARIRQLTAAGKLPFIDTPYGKLYPRSFVEELAAQRKKAGRPKRGPKAKAQR